MKRIDKDPVPGLYAQAFAKLDEVQKGLNDLGSRISEGAEITGTCRLSRDSERSPEDTTGDESPSEVRRLIQRRDIAAEFREILSALHATVF